ncbi:methyltransferase domain-containing protein [Herbaspirillum sp. NPDC101396]|uniref:methyltransferase domain-containing protein n=1 Tax=Herbaspirillum sp. NPDC101396 TaxID=3364005 RepID=UPI00383B02DD
MRASSQDYFDALYERSDDPWRIAGNWYEQRKRGLVTAVLPRLRFRHAFEPACGSGELSLELGRRCDRLLCSDFSATAVEIAQERWQQAGAGSRGATCDARFVRMAVPEEWPEQLGPAFDLIILSEFGYYLAPDALNTLPALANASLAADGVLVACHWKHDFAQRVHSAAAVHALFDALDGLHRCGHYEDADFLLDAWSREPRSVATLEELT